MDVNTAKASVGANIHRDLCHQVLRDAARAKGAVMQRAIDHADRTGKPVLESERSSSLRPGSPTSPVRSWH